MSKHGMKVDGSSGGLIELSRRIEVPVDAGDPWGQKRSEWQRVFVGQPGAARALANELLTAAEANEKQFASLSGQPK